jgi:leucyl-tRNA---protein transferase
MDPEPPDTADQAESEESSAAFPRIDDVVLHTQVPGSMMDELWEEGWRHQGMLFYRYSETDIGGEHHHITPLRIDVNAFTPNKTQRRVLRANADLRCEFVPANFDEDIRYMFHLHCSRFADNVPESLDNFFSHYPASLPCQCEMQRVMLGDELIAVSFMDIGQAAGSSVYAIFAPEHSQRRLGTFTLLGEIEHARQLGMRWLYHGYATVQPSHYDYKKGFRAVQWLHWRSGMWRELDHTRQVGGE